MQKVISFHSDFMKISFFVCGEPKAQPRVKAFRRGKFTGVYTPKSADDWKAAVRKTWKETKAERFLFGPLEVNLEFRIQRPKSHYTGKGELKKSSPIDHTCRGDVDNFCKAVLDALTDAGAWIDDASIVLLTAKKEWADDALPGCQVSISTL
jgi:Holliday junction resolvase RusA-like endonuclease